MRIVSQLILPSAEHQLLPGQLVFHHCMAGMNMNMSISSSLVLSSQLSWEQHKTPAKDIVYHFACLSSTALKRFVDPTTGDFLPNLIISDKLSDDQMVIVKKAFAKANVPEVVIHPSNTLELPTSKRRSIKCRLRRNAAKASKHIKGLVKGKLVEAKKGQEDVTMEGVEEDVTMEGVEEDVTMGGEEDEEEAQVSQAVA
jgi:hypothetical protein